MFGAHNLGRNYKKEKRKKERKKEDRFFYVGIVDKKNKMELEIPVPPSLTKYQTN